MSLVTKTQQVSGANSCLGILSLQNSGRGFWEKHNRIFVRIFIACFLSPKYPSFFLPASLIDYLAKLKFYPYRFSKALLILKHSRRAITKGLFEA